MTLDPTIEARVQAKRAAPLEQDADALALLDEVERLRGVLEHLTLLHGAERVRAEKAEAERDAAIEGRAEVFFAAEDRERLRAWEDAARRAWSICAETAPEDCPGPDAVRAAVDRLDDDAIRFEGECVVQRARAEKAEAELLAVHGDLDKAVDQVASLESALDDATIAALRAEVERLTGLLRMLERTAWTHRDSEKVCVHCWASVPWAYRDEAEMEHARGCPVVLIPAALAAHDAGEKKEGGGT